MKKWQSFLVFFIGMFSYFGITAQQYKVDTIQYRGALEKIINLVILPDGYTEDEMGKFSADARKLANDLFSQQPFQEYKSYFNVFSILVPSTSSGASHPANATDVTEPVFPAVSTSNRFGSTFDFAQIHRLLVPTRTFNINNVLAQNFPQYDQVLVLVNSPHYGGSGGTFATSSLHTNASEIAIHEIGHSFAGLADEYYAGDQYAREEANMTQIKNTDSVRWKNWMGEKSVGIYQHCCDGNSRLWYRPHNNCKMRLLNRPFCPICVQAIIEKIHNLISPILDYSPQESFITETFPVSLSIDLVKPDPNTLRIRWLINDEILPVDTDTLLLEQFMLPSGRSIVQCIVEDTTELLRIDEHGDIHSFHVQWEFENQVTSVDLLDQKSFNITVHPNPSHGFIDINYAKGHFLHHLISIYDLNGQLLLRKKATAERSQIDLSHFPSGSYLLTISDENRFIFQKFIQKL